MLTFSEALTQLKAGQDLRQPAWPAGYFVRIVMTRWPTGLAPELRQFKPGSKAGSPYLPTQPEMLGNTWIAA